MRRIALLTLLVALVPVVGCGPSDGGGLDFVSGPLQFALALPGTGESVVVGLKNLATEDALVTVTAYTAAGVATPIPVPGVLVPARGEVQINLAAPPADGWVHVETRDPVTLALLPTSGAIVPYVQKQGPGPRGEYGFGLPFAAVEAAMPFGPDTTTVQVINATRVTAAPATFDTLLVDITLFDTAGVVLNPGAPPVLLAANAVELVSVPAGTAGQVKVEIVADLAAKLEAFTLATREDPAGFGEAIGFGLDRRLDVQTIGPSRFLELALEFGRTPAEDFRDLAILATNATDGALAVQFQEIRDTGGGQFLLAPRVFTLGPRETRYFATTYAGSIGLEIGEVHPFADLFGDVFLQAGIRVLRWSLVYPDGIVLTAPNFDPAFFQSYQEVPEGELSSNAIVVGIEQETTTLGAERNWITMTNPAPADARVFLRVFTPGGTEYLLPNLIVPALGRLDWSPDALVLNNLLGIREDQTVPTDPPVPFFSVQLSSTTGLGFFGRREIRDPTGYLVMVAPHVVELLDDEP